MAFFKEPEGYDINFFTIFTQLYGEDAPYPQLKSAYISYIDSVKLYDCKDRTNLYHMIVLGLFAFLKANGYEKIFIWSCPPDDGVDYVFPFKPPNQKMPNSHILDEWYVKMFESGKEMEIINEVQGCESFAFHNNWEDIKNIPLFHDDLWVVKLKEIISQADTEYAKLQTSFKASGHAKCDNKRERMWELLQVHTKAFDQSYFVLTLENPSREMKELKGVERNWIGNRHLLVDFFCEPKLMFKDIRQARFATYCLLYRIFLENSVCIHCHERQHLNVRLFKKYMNFIKNVKILRIIFSRLIFFVLNAHERPAMEIDITYASKTMKVNLSLHIEQKSRNVKILILSSKFFYN
jgi:hypothetical protein